MIMQRDVFTVSSATLILCQLLSGQVHAAVDSKNNTEMVRVPGGVFLMGSSDGPEDERPQHQVNVGEFFLDRTPVTNAQFAQFLNTKGTQAADGQRWYDIDDNDARIHGREGKWTADTGSENHPVVEASWYGAVAYCAWLAKRLPTEAEWEKPRGEPMGENTRGETRCRIGVERISARVGTIFDQSVAYRKARVPMVFSISPVMVGNGSAALIFPIRITQMTDARI
jgi:hypothetical protein